MFDYYVPHPPLACRGCRATLDGFQGKDGPCDLLVWEQGAVAPTDQIVDDQWKLSELALGALRLPPRFEISTRCVGCENSVNVTGFCEQETWTRCVFGSHSDATPIPAVPVSDTWRQCTRCTDAWEEAPENELSGCPSCGALTILSRE
jgi:hypothetical protein